MATELFEFIENNIDDAIFENVHSRKFPERCLNGNTCSRKCIFSMERGKYAGNRQNRKWEPSIRQGDFFGLKQNGSSERLGHGGQSVVFKGSLCGQPVGKSSKINFTK